LHAWYRLTLTTWPVSHSLLSVAFFVQPEPVEGGLSVVGQSARGFGCIAQIVAIAIVVGIASHAAGVLDDIVREVAK
jgi:hypothetical protein